MSDSTTPRPGPVPQAPTIATGAQTEQDAVDAAARRIAAKKAETKSDPGQRSPAELRSDLEALRTELGETVEELHHRVDVPTRVRESAAGAADTVKGAAAGAAAFARDQVELGRQVLADKAPPVEAELRERPGRAALIAAVPVVLIFVLLVFRRRGRRDG